MTASFPETKKATRPFLGTKKWRRGFNRTALAYAFSLPAILLFIVFKFYPIVLAFVMSLQRFVPLGARPFVGFSNYEAVMNDDLFWLSLKNTSIYVVFVVGAGAMISLALAYLVNQRIRGVKVFRTIYFLPVVTSLVVISIVWKYLYYPSPRGLFNQIIGMVGIPAQTWLSDPRLALGAIIVMAIWARVGYDMVIYLAALQGLEKDVLEAASIDGATWWKRFWHIELPSIRFAVFIVTILGVMRAYRVFTPILIMTNGDPNHGTEVLATYIYRTGFMNYQMDHAAAMSFILFLVILILTLFQLNVEHRVEGR